MLKTAKFVNKASKNSSNSNFLASKRCYSTERVLKPHEKFRNIAICAHVDHGKTTLVDCLLYQAGAFVKNIQGDRVMDSNQLEKERGITILSKWTSVQYGDYIMNIVDTPGHADFGGEVERILSMVDSVCLLVDATEGVMPQTKFVLQKALSRGLRPLVVVNKVDRPSARLGQVENEIFELFISLDASEEQLDFPVLYASAKEGWAVTEPGNDKKDMQPLFEAIIKHVPTPKIIEDEPFKMLVSNLEHDKHFGRILTGKIYAGKIKVGDKIKGLSREGGKIEEGKVMKLFSRRGLQQVPVEIAEAGDIIAVSGLTKTGVTDSVVDMSIEAPIPALPLDPPIVAINIGVNDSPLCGKEGKLVSAITLRDRLTKEAECNVTLQVAQTPDNDAFEVRGRGELQIGILVEQMRREGFELSISPPRVMYKEIDGEMMEPVEEVIIDIEDEYASVVMERLNNRKGEMIESTSLNNKTRLRYYVSARCLIGYRSEFKNDTHGTGTMNTIFHEYQPFKGKLENVRKGALISTCSGTVTAYALEGLQARAVMFVSPQTPVYEGMIVGENSRDADMEVNPTKAKQLTNVRASGKDDAIKLAPPRQMTLEEAMCYVQADELLEVTPKSIRLRKKLLDGNERKKARRAEGQF